MDKSVNGPLAQGNVVTEWVWFDGATALKEGQGVCYNFDYGTASEANCQRGNRVELPSAANARYFAGVAARDYSACATGQFIEIYCPGSTCKVLTKADCTLGSGILTCQAGGTDAGYFTYAGFEGEGSAVPLQTVDRSSTAGTVLAKLQTGEPSGLVEVVTAVVGANAFLVGGVTYIIGADIASDCTDTLANGTISGVRKKFEVITTAVTTSDVVVTVTSGEQRSDSGDDGPDALASVTLNAVGEKILLEWVDGVWKELYSTGATLA